MATWQILMGRLLKSGKKLRDSGKSSLTAPRGEEWSPRFLESSWAASLKTLKTLQVSAGGDA